MNEPSPEHCIQMRAQYGSSAAMCRSKSLALSAHGRLVAQICEALFDKPGMTLLELANQLREIRGSGPALLRQCEETRNG